MNLKSHILSPLGRKSLKRDFFQKIWLCHFSLHCILTSGKKIENFYKQFQRKTLDRQKNKRTNRQRTRQTDNGTEGILQDLNFMEPKSVFSLLFCYCVQPSQLPPTPSPLGKPFTLGNHLASLLVEHFPIPGPYSQINNGLNMHIS